MKRVKVLMGVAVVFLAGPMLLAAEPAAESATSSEAPMQKMHPHMQMMDMNDMEMHGEDSQGMAEDMPCQRMVAMHDQHHDMQAHRKMMHEMMQHMSEHQDMQVEPGE